MKRREGFRMALEMERMPRGKWWGRRKCEACHRREFVKFKERAERMERERAGVGGE